MAKRYFFSGIKSVMFFVFFTSVLSNSLNAQCDEPESKKGKSNFSEAIEFVEKTKVPDCKTPDFFLNQAMDLLREVEKSDPQFAGTYFYMGYVFSFRDEGQNLKMAVKNFEKCIELCPDYNPDMYYFLSKIAFGNDDFVKSSEYAQKYLTYLDVLTNDEYIADAKLLANDAKKKVDLIGTPVVFNPVIVKGISSKFNEYLVIISPDNEQAFFTRQQEKSHMSSSYGSEINFEEKFFMSERLANGEFDEGRALGFPFNRRQNEGGATVTIDNRELFYTVCDWVECAEKGGKYYNCDIYYTKVEFGDWAEITPLAGEVNSDCSWETQPSISSDGQTLYFVSSRSGGFGGYDIYTSERQSDGSWGPAINLGKSINTQGNEKTPFIHTDSQTLYFSTDGRPGIGSYDIYYSRKNDDGTWTEPKNIGYPINTQYEDIGFIVSTDGRYGYFASDRLGLGPGGKDFYSFELYEDARPEKVLFIKGNVTDEQTEAPVGAKVEIRNMESKKIYQVPVDSETGSYVVALPFKSDYVLTVKKEDYVYESMYIAMEDSSYDSPATVNLEIQQVEIGKSYKLNDIYYEYDSDILTPESKKVIDEFVIFLTENPTIKVAINGHTDNVGGAEYNKNLSERRAKSVYDYLILQGIVSTRLSYEGFGFAKPVATNDTDEGRALNRRTEFVIVNK